MAETLSKGCPECGMGNLFWNKVKGEVVCRECGLVIEDKLLDFGPEWREFESDDEGKRRTGSSLTYLQPSISTDVGRKSDLYQLNKGNRDKFFRLRRWQNRTYTSIEQNLNQALPEIKRVSSLLDLPNSVSEEAARLYTMALQRGLVRGRGIELMVSGAVHAACKVHEVPKTLKELAHATELEEKEIGRAYRFLRRMLNVRVLPVDPINFVNKFASSLRLSPKTQTEAVRIIQRAQKSRLISGKCPNSIAATALYIASLQNKEKRTQQEFSKVAKITEVTLRNRYVEFISELGMDKSKLLVRKKAVVPKERVSRKAGRAQHKAIKRSAKAHSRHNKAGKRRR
ncbi:MAG TPA: TFIIB-type zinc ribbon-containing protein [Candidatus Nanoarchaeia archaeon]|nr:TFIIB-type zinc ribbon-containing protein [Candidatus Nanoarchaeia archaeon]